MQQHKITKSLRRATQASCSCVFYRAPPTSKLQAFHQLSNDAAWNTAFLHDDYSACSSGNSMNEVLKVWVMLITTGDACENVAKECSARSSFVVPYKAKAIPSRKFHAKAEEKDARAELLLPEIRRQALR